MAFGFLNRLGILTVLLCAFVSGLEGRTLVPPGNVSGTWSAANSPYVIKTGNITIPNGSSLVIQAGVTVEFQGHHKFIVNGHLRALGTAADSVRFVGGPRAGNVQGWKGLRLIGADSTLFEYCVFQDGNAILGNSSDSTGGAVFISGTGTHVIFRNSEFRNNFAGGNAGALFVSGGTSAQCFDCRFSDNYTAKDGGAAFINNSSLTRFERCVFERNGSGKEAGAIHSRNGAPSYIDCEFYHNGSFNSGGAVMASGQPSFRRCTFMRNRSETSQGGGLYFYDSLTTATLDSCLIMENRTLLRDGGGAYCWEASPRFTDCQFINNESSDDGGGIHCYRLGSNPVFTRCLFEGNTAADRGGGIKISRYSRATLTDCVIRNNRSNGTGGGGVFCRLQCEPVFTNCVIENNSATGSGGGVCAIESNPRFFNCILSANETDSSGGGIFGHDADVDFTNCVVQGNHARMNGGGLSLTLSSPDIIRTRVQDNLTDSLGGGFYMRESVSPVDNCLITGNVANVAGGAVWVTSSNPRFKYCTISDNRAATGRSFYVLDGQGSLLNSIVANQPPEFGNGGSPTGAGFVASQTPWIIRNTLFYATGNPEFTGAWPTGFGVSTSQNANGTPIDGYGNIFANPRFVNSGPEPYILQTSEPRSAALNASSDFTGSSDLLSETRPMPFASLADLGCFEASQSGAGEGLWGIQYGQLTPGVHRVYGDIIVPQNQELIVPAGTELEFMGPFAILVYGSLKVNGIADDSVKMYAELATNINLWRGIRFYGELSSQSQLSHATIEHAQSWPVDSAGGGLSFFAGSSPLIQNCLIHECSAAGSGGGLFVSGGAPTIESSIVEHCTSLSGGGIRVNPQQSITLRNCSVRECSSGVGGAVSVEGGTIRVENSLLAHNAAEDGGAIHARNAVIELLYSVLDYNSASRFGGAVYGTNCTVECDSLRMTNGTSSRGGAGYFVSSSGNISGLWSQANSASEQGGAFYIQGGRISISRGLISGNAAVTNGGGMVLLSDSTTINRCTVTTNSAAVGAALYLENSACNVNSSIITENGPAVYFRSSAGARIEYSNFDRNFGANFTFYSANPSHGPAQIGVLNSANQLEETSDSYANIFVPSQFVNLPGGNYYLEETSHCMDAGDPELNCDPDLTYIEIGAFHTTHTLNQWPPEELTTVVIEGDSMQLVWNRSKPVRQCNANGLNFVVEALNSLGVWQTAAATTDTFCVIPISQDVGNVVQVRVRSVIGP